MPWWGYLYLLILTLLGVAGTIEQFRTKQIIHGLFTLFSLSAFALFLWGYFNPAFAESLSYWPIAILLAVGLYDWWLCDYDLQPGSDNFGKKLPEAKSKLNDLGATLILLPAYLAGLSLCYRVIMNA